MTQTAYTGLGGLNIQGVRTLRNYMKDILKTERHLDICADALKISKEEVVKILASGMFPHISTAAAMRIASATETSPRELLIAQVDTKLALDGGVSGLYPDTAAVFNMTRNDDNGGHDSLIMDDGFIIK